MNRVLKVLNHPFFFWAVLSLPAVPMIIGLIASGDSGIYKELLHPTGEFSARFLIISLMITPLILLLPGWRGPRWLLRRRRYLGVAAFGYALVHTVLYLLDRGSVAFSQPELVRIY